VARPACRRWLGKRITFPGWAKSKLVAKDGDLGSDLGGRAHTSERSSTVWWLNVEDSQSETRWVSDRLAALAHSANDQLWNYEGKRSQSYMYMYVIHRVNAHSGLGGFASSMRSRTSGRCAQQGGERSKSDEPALYDTNGPAPGSDHDVTIRASTCDVLRYSLQATTHGTQIAISGQWAE
jgi:hypothetical protein